MHVILLIPEVTTCFLSPNNLARMPKKGTDFHFRKWWKPISLLLFSYAFPLLEECISIQFSWCIWNDNSYLFYCIQFCFLKNKWYMCGTCTNNCPRCILMSMSIHNNQHGHVKTITISWPNLCRAHLFASHFRFHV